MGKLQDACAHVKQYTKLPSLIPLDSTSTTPYHSNPSVAHILYENGARLSIDRAATFLCMSAAEGDFPMLRLLSECGIETNIGKKKKMKNVCSSSYVVHLKISFDLQTCTHSRL